MTKDAKLPKAAEAPKVTRLRELVATPDQIVAGESDGLLVTPLGLRKAMPGLVPEPQPVIRGSVGKRGHDGVPGKVGLMGEPGPRGFQGPQGVKGPLGDRGLKGNPGKPGQKGDRGDPSEDGADGAPGRRGDIGPPGPKGDMGEPGRQGRPGQKGDKGDEGPPGSKGDRGDPGKDGSVSRVSRAGFFSRVGYEVKDHDKGAFDIHGSSLRVKQNGVFMIIGVGDKPLSINKMKTPYVPINGSFSWCLGLNAGDILEVPNADVLTVVRL